MDSLDEGARQIHKIALDKGFWDGYRPIDSFPFYAYKLAMINSEVTEVLEAIRKDQGDEQVVLEIADIIIRTLDFYQGLKTTGEIGPEHSLDDLIGKKILVNQERPQKHGVRG